MNDEASKYPGQGNAVPDTLGMGAWLDESQRLFLSLDDTELDDGWQLKSAARQLPNGDYAFGLGAARVANLLAMTVADLMEGNRTGLLRYFRDCVPPDPGFEHADKFTFMLHNRVARLTVNGVRPGHA